MKSWIGGLVLGLLCAKGWAQNTPPSYPTSLEGAFENAIEGTNERNWCQSHPQECRARKEEERSNQFKLQEKKERRAFCERYPWRCENQENHTKPREKISDCEQFPWNCPEK